MKFQSIREAVAHALKNKQSLVLVDSYNGEEARINLVDKFFGFEIQFDGYLNDNVTVAISRDQLEDALVSVLHQDERWTHIKNTEGELLLSHN